MYHHLRGRLERKSPAEVVLDVGGIGYLLAIPLSTYERLPAEGETVRLLTTFVVREDAHRLYGFATADERAFFALLQTVTGVGPQVALGIVSALPVREFRAAVAAADPTRLRRVKGIGKRLSERLVVELRDRIDVLGASDPVDAEDAAERDAVLALQALGFGPDEARAAVEAARREGDASAGNAGDLVRRALRRL